MKGLTKRQIQVITFIQDYTKLHAYPPTIRETAAHFDISVKAAYDHVNALKKKGIIKSNSNRSRSIEIIDNNFSPDTGGIQIPLLGSVAAGLPLMAEENMERMLTLPQDMLKPGKAFFALRIQGDSMINAGIHDGDIAVIRQQNTAENGNIIVARIQEEAVTLKRFYRENNRIRLQAENDAYPPIYTQDVRVLGTLQMIIRNYE
jgi:repressor LexA